MISIIDIGPLHKVRIWIDELPAIPHPAQHAIELFVHADRQSAFGPRIAAIESRRIVGPRAIYGLLGATCDSRGKESVVKLVVSGSAGGHSRRLDWAMGNEGDPVTPDVYPEFANIILEGASSAASIGNAGGAELRFFGAKAEAGSSPKCFYQLAQALTQLLVGQQWPPLKHEDAIRKCLYADSEPKKASVKLVAGHQSSEET